MLPVLGLKDNYFLVRRLRTCPQKWVFFNTFPKWNAICMHAWRHSAMRYPAYAEIDHVRDHVMHKNILRMYGPWFADWFNTALLYGPMNLVDLHILMLVQTKLGKLFSRTKEENILKWSTVEYSGVQWRTVEYSGVQWSTVKYSGVQWSTVEYSGVQWSRVEYVLNGPMFLIQ